MKSTFGTSNTVATRANAGSPMIFAWAAHPRDSEDCSASVGLDLRAVPRRLGGTSWKLRLDVEVEVIEEKERKPRTLQQLQILAFDLASRVRRAMSGSSFKETLAGRGFNRLTGAVSAGKHDGFKSSTELFDFDAWNQRVARSEKCHVAGPFGNDRGFRLATTPDPEQSTLTRNGIEEPVVEIVSILYEAASQTLE